MDGPNILSFIARMVTKGRLRKFGSARFFISASERPASTAQPLRLMAIHSLPKRDNFFFIRHRHINR